MQGLGATSARLLLKPATNFGEAGAKLCQELQHWMLTGRFP